MALDVQGGYRAVGGRSCVHLRLPCGCLSTRLTVSLTSNSSWRQRGGGHVEHADIKTCRYQRGSQRGPHRFSRVPRSSPVERRSQKSWPVDITTRIKFGWCVCGCSLSAEAMSSAISKVSRTLVDMRDEDCGCAGPRGQRCEDLSGEDLCVLWCQCKGCQPREPPAGRRAGGGS